MTWKRRLGRNLLFALLCGAVASALYWGLLYTKSFHHFSVIMLGPAWDFANRHHPSCGPSLRCTLEVLVVNVVLYTFWIFVALIGIDVLRQKK